MLKISVLNITCTLCLPLWVCCETKGSNWSAGATVLKHYQFHSFLYECCPLDTMLSKTNVFSRWRKLITFIIDLNRAQCSLLVLWAVTFANNLSSKDKEISKRVNKWNACAVFVNTSRWLTREIHITVWVVT